MKFHNIALSGAVAIALVTTTAATANSPAESIIDVPAKQASVSGTSDPDCKLASCATVTAAVPASVTVDRVELYVKEPQMQQWLGPCPRHAEGGNFMDCAVLDKPGGGKLGYIRGIGTQYSQMTTATNITVSWAVKNWADIPRNVKLVVFYH